MDIRDLKINPDDLSRELSEQAAKFLYVAELAVNSDQAYDSFKSELDRLEAAISMNIRRGALETKAKITEKGIIEQMISDDRHIKAKKQLLELRGKKDLLRALREAWMMRKDLLLRLAVLKRNEMEVFGGETVPGISLEDMSKSA